MYDPNTLRDRLKNDGVVIGPFSRIGDPAAVEICGYGGFDFVVVDMEHGPNNPYVLQNLCRAGDSANIAVLVRTSTVEEIGKSLDVGAAGVQVPQICSKKMAEEAVQAAKFAPMGMRGVCKNVRAALYSHKDRYRYFSEANDTVVILQIEGKEGLDNLDEILEVPGVDIIFVGPYDLSQSLGLTGQIDHPDVVAAMLDIVSRCREKGVIAGCYCDTIENARKWSKLGVQYINYGIDVSLFLEKCKSTVESIRSVE